MEGCGPPGMWRDPVHTVEVRKEQCLGIVMAGGHGSTRGWLRRKEQLRGVISALRPCTEMRTMAHFKGRKAEVIEKARTKVQRRNHCGRRVPQASWI